ncbi:DNA topoisomerase IB [Sulfitobacter aestuarii]|uniref:DNA topoisomerase n=1 Tax=Sulfitobacter aestuarii TaxID=2161676 RepID=A0ABW5U6Q4_9RHOB
MAPSELVYYSDDQPGIRRLRRGRGFSYVATDGTTIARGPERKRLEALAVPPAYEDVWMCPLPNGHLQATGRDARQRKQYRYHEAWAAAQAETKFAGLVEFGHLLPRIRRRVRRDLEEEVGDRVFALASAVALIDRTSMRVGNADYTAANGSYGALTLQRRHVKLAGNRIKLRYKAKGGTPVRRQMNDRTLARILGRINDLPGAELLSWVDEEGNARSLNSTALNLYIAQAAGADGVSAKTFRTWAGTLAAFACAEPGGASIKAMAEAAAERLNNTATVARNSYIHPAVIELAGAEPLVLDGTGSRDLLAAERRLLAYLETC